MIEIRGIGVSGKKTSGIVFKIDKKPNLYRNIKPNDIDTEKKRFHESLEIARQEVKELYLKAVVDDQNNAEIFTSHELLLSDIELIKYIEQLLDYEYDLLSALIRTREDMKVHFLNMQSEIFRSKVNDIDDIFERLIRIESGINDEYQFPKQPFILVCEDILPSLIYRIPDSSLKGIITRFGSNCSHGVILARAKNIPVIIRIKNRFEMINNEDKVIMNGESGAIFVLDN